MSWQLIFSWLRTQQTQKTLQHGAIASTTQQTVRVAGTVRDKTMMA